MRKLVQGFFALNLVIAGLVAFAYPPVNKEGDLAVATFALAFQDAPSGVYYDRQFDWPTGEAIWIDVPVWVLDIGLLGILPLLIFTPSLHKNPGE